MSAVGGIFLMEYLPRRSRGAFLIPFCICLILCGLPLYFLEVTLGQFLSRGTMHAWSICPLLKGIGISMNIVSFICSWYYTIILAWTLIFTVNSFKSPLPWTQCGQDWNSEACVLPDQWHNLTANESTLLGNDTFSSRNEAVLANSSISLENATLLGNISATSGNVTLAPESAAVEFWRNNVLELSPGLEHMDGIPWHSAVALLASSVIVALCIVKGVRSVGKVVYVTATLPYILLGILIITGATLPGSIDGVLFYVKPDFR